MSCRYLMSKRFGAPGFSLVLVSCLCSLVFFIDQGESTPIVYPANGQSPQQMDKDTYECYVWAKQQTGYDPLQRQTTAQQTSSPSQGGERLQGAVRGAAVGAVVGGIAGDAGKGAVAGAAGGAMIGGMKKRESRRQQARMQEQQAASGQGNYDRAYAACLEGRKYTVK